MTGNSWDADELAQETALQAWAGWSHFKHKSHADTWLYSIMVNLNRKRLRAEQRRRRRRHLWFWRAPDNPERQPDQSALQVEWAQSLWSTVATLPTPQREAVVLRYAEGLSHEAIAVILGCPAGTVKSRIHHGILALRRALGDPLEQKPKAVGSSMPAK